MESTVEFAPAPMGHNAPPLKERLPIDYAHLAEEVSALADRADIAPRVVDDDEAHGVIATIVTDATMVSKRIEAIRVQETAPFLAGQREVMGFFKPLLERVEALSTRIAARGEDYLRRKKAEEQRRRDEEERKRREAARLAHEEAQRLLREAAEAARRKQDADRRAREEEDKRLREAARLKREEEDRAARAADAARREEEARAAREADNASRQKRQAAERAASARREQEAREAAEAARMRAEAERVAADEAARLEADRLMAAEMAARAEASVKAALAIAAQAEVAQLEAERRADAAPADMARTRVGNTLSTLKRGWDFEVMDWDGLDLNELRHFFKQQDIEKAVRAFIKINGNAKTLKGIRVFETEKASYR